MDHKSFSQSVLQKIKDEHIEPRPQWHFMLKNSIFWILFALSMLIGARAMGVVFFIFSDLNFSLAQGAGGPAVPEFLKILPLFWLSVFTIVVLIAILGLHHTKRGYKISIATVILINLLGTIALGLALFALGDGERFEQEVSERLPIQQPHARRAVIWQQPSEGRLAGEVVSDGTAEKFSLSDLSGQQWTVTCANTLVFNESANTCAKLQTGMRVRMIGTPTDDNTFAATRIDPWNQLPPPPRGRQMQPLGGQRMGPGPNQMMPPPQQNFNPPPPQNPGSPKP